MHQLVFPPLLRWDLALVSSLFAFFNAFSYDPRPLPVICAALNTLSHALFDDSTELCFPHIFLNTFYFSCCNCTSTLYSIIWLLSPSCFLLQSASRLIFPPPHHSELHT
ncbi:unnamed protein product, partial [Ectocarpus fasciculatus]